MTCHSLLLSKQPMLSSFPRVREDRIAPSVHSCAHCREVEQHVKPSNAVLLHCLVAMAVSTAEQRMYSEHVTENHSAQKAEVPMYITDEDHAQIMTSDCTHSMVMMLHGHLNESEPRATHEACSTPGARERECHSTGTLEAPRPGPPPCGRPRRALSRGLGGAGS